VKVTFDSVHALASALRRAAEAHASDSGPDPDPEWPTWYAHHMATFIGSDRFTRLPEPVRLQDTTATHPAAAPPDPTGNRDPDRDFLLRYAPTDS
jgi:hypothetical protein